jgi:hypothetical protein
VTPEQIPTTAHSLRGTPRGWRGVAHRIIDDSRLGQVTVVRVKDEAEYRKLRNGISGYLREAKIELRTRVAKLPDGQLECYLQVAPPALEITRSKPAAASSAAPPRRISVGNRNNAQAR